MKTHARVTPVIVSGMSLVAACGADSKDERSTEERSADRSSAAPSAAAVDPARQAEIERDALQRHLQAAARSPRRNPVGGAQDAEANREAALAAARRDAIEFGMIGLLNSGAGGDPDAPTAPWGREDSLGSGFGAEGFEGTGSGRLGGSHKTPPPKLRMGATTVTGRLPGEVIQRIVRQNFGRFRLCYEKGLEKDATLAGKITVKFKINADGSIGEVKSEADLPDPNVVECVRKAFYGLSFPQPEGGHVTVSYPIMFSPAEPSKAPAAVGPLNGKFLAEATWEDAKAALEKAGCTDVKKLEDPASIPQKVVMTAQKDGKKVTITYVNGATLPADEIKALETSGSVYRSKQFMLAIVIEGDASRAASKALLDAVIVR